MVRTRPLWTIDACEHVSFMDRGCERKAPITALFTNVDWSEVEARCTAIRG